MKHKQLLVVTTLIILVIATGILVAIFIKSKSHNSTGEAITTTTYEDEGGWIYVCSTPIKARYQGVTYMSGAPSPTPIDPSEAAKYCHKTGVE